MNKVKKYRAIIIDDEFAARELLKIELLEIARDIEIVAICDSFESAQIALQNIECDLAFIDIIMPRGNGLDLIRNIKNRNFYPIFVSSHLEYAIEAIKEEAFDYILKPFKTEILEETIDRFKKSISNHEKSNISKANFSEFFEAKDQASSVFIPQKDIKYLEADGSYTKIFYLDEVFTMSKNLKFLSTQLDERKFFRCSKKHLVNIEQIVRIDHIHNFAKFKGGSKIKISKRKKEGLLHSLREYKIG